VVFLVLYLNGKGYSAVEAGGAVSAYGVGSIASSLVGGQLADRLGRRDAIVLSMAGSAATMMALSQADRLSLIITLSALVGFFSELYRPASSALLADLVPTERRVSAFGLYRFAINVGFAAGPATAGLLAERSFFLVFLGDALTSLAFGAIAFLFLPPGRPASRETEQRGEALRAIAHDRAFLLFLGASVLGAFVYFQQQSTLPLQVEADGFSKTVYGALISLNGLAVVLFELPLISFTRRLPRRPVIAAGFLLVGIGFSLTALADSVVALAATVFVWTIGEMVNAPVASAYVADLSPTHLRGRYVGVWGLTFGVGLVLAPLVGTALWRQTHTGLWLACLAAGGLAAALVLPKRAPSQG
jgi:MFS family permease